MDEKKKRVIGFTDVPISWLSEGGGDDEGDDEEYQINQSGSCH